MGKAEKFCHPGDIPISLVLVKIDHDDLTISQFFTCKPKLVGFLFPHAYI